LVDDRGIEFEFAIGPGQAPRRPSGASLISTEEGGGDQELSFGGIAPGGRGGGPLDFLLVPGSMEAGRAKLKLGWASVGRVASGIKPFSFPGSSSEVGSAMGCTASGTCRSGFVGLPS